MYATNDRDRFRKDRGRADVRVGIDGRSLVESGGRGIARYTHTLLSTLAATFPDDEWRVLVPAGRASPSVPGTVLVRARLPSRALYGLAGMLGRPHLDEVLGGVDVFWAPAPAPLALSADVPFVLSLHDLSWELRPSDFTRYERAWHRIARPPLLAARAARVIAVSDVTREQAIDRWRLDPQRIVTVREGIPAPDDAAPGEVGSTGRARAIPGRYLLSVGALEPRKAPDVLMAAYRRARAAGLDAALVVVGEGRSKTAVSGPGVHALGHVTDPELEQLYAGALALVAPSRLEGFGLVPLEAALRGIPAIVSDLPVFRETLGEGALRVPVDDVAALAAAMFELAADSRLRARLAGYARDKARQLTPERSAAALRAVFADVAGR
jgi:glycosyltransferase involved in cell wall biosynthesis